jgi:hypothetical protein
MRIYRKGFLFFDKQINGDDDLIEFEAIVAKKMEGRPAEDFHVFDIRMTVVLPDSSHKLKPRERKVWTKGSDEILMCSEDEEDATESESIRSCDKTLSC